MSDLVLLPSRSYQTPSPPGRRGGRSLNTIIEENEELSPSSARQEQRKKPAAMTMSAMSRRNASNNHGIEQWLSPLSDHFPTPRGFHFLAAPVLPSSPSAASADEDAEETASDTSSSNPSSSSWNQRSSTVSDATDFDDIYDLSDEEQARKERLRSNGLARRSSSRRSAGARGSSQTAKALPRLIIPAARETIPDQLSARSLKKMMSPVAPTPTSIVDMSPAVKSFMQAQQALEVPTISAPPSLDGSLSSEQLAAMSAPPTPIIGAEEEGGADWSGVQLQPGALATLQALSGGDEDVEVAPEQVIEMPQAEMTEMRHETPRLITSFPRASAFATPSLTQTPSLRRSLAGLTRLDIPSPGGFFNELSPRSRRTWHLPGGTPADEVPPPTSTTAEQFYKTPWTAEPAPPMPLVPAEPVSRPLHMAQGNFSSSPVEQFADMSESLIGDPPTAIRVQPTPVTALMVPSDAPAVPALPTVEPSSPAEAVEIVGGQESEHKRDLELGLAQAGKEAATSHVNRTELWLRAQRAYLKGVDDSDDEKDDEEDKEDEEDTMSIAATQEDQMAAAPEAKETEANCTLTRKKTVRFSIPQEKKTTSPTLSSPPQTAPCSLPSKLARLESAYYRAFQDYTVRSGQADGFTNRLARFEAVQAQRVSLRESYRNQLLGKYQLSVVPQSAKKRMSANVARGDHDVVLEDPEKLRMDKEQEALRQMALSTWHVAATKLLNGGRLIAAPVAKRLARQSRMAPGADGSVARDRARILDLGGQSTCDWAWHAALQYPNTKIYTVTTKAIRQVSNSNIRGPPNHRQVAVERLTRLPFADNQFDLVSARELHSILKFTGENGEDEWEACLRECLRVLKPGGYLEFSVLDSEVVNAGPRGLALAVEFGFALRTLGYDANPTRLFLGRLARAGFEDVRRAWMCLPMGPKPAARGGVAANNAAAPGSASAAGSSSNGLNLNKQLPLPRDSAGNTQRYPAKQQQQQQPEGQTLRLEAMVSGSADDVACVTGLLAGWSWERWLLRCEMERAAGELRLADTVTGAGDALRAADKGLDGVHAVIEEGRARGSGWRLLKGYARKPRGNVGVINMCLDTSALH